MSSATTSKKNKSHTLFSALKSLVLKNSLGDLSEKLQKMMNLYQGSFVSFWIFLMLRVGVALLQFHWYEQNYIIDVKLPLDQTHKLENMSEQSVKCVGVLRVEHNITKEQKVSGNLNHRNWYQ